MSAITDVRGLRSAPGFGGNPSALVVGKYDEA